eukprot:CAMPEP_0119370154 /NCGR_PEP_ID=MMETSP1334-20130426/16552_1 /TAXON_ID=127549 /ORGANISM="Calcidiscus leptoporus, Strain RCC1130" /LENGTH=2388 /DNA_ID=CAMNT_0007387159 /DNA_START=53 /DNA_END=7219 /DNA_ORIENTATION=-
MLAGVVLALSAALPSASSAPSEMARKHAAPRAEGGARRLVPTRAPPPPVRLYSTVPPPPSPPPGLLASFDPSAGFSTVEFGSWAAGAGTHGLTALVVAQAQRHTLDVYGVLSGLEPSATAQSKVFAAGCPAAAPSDAQTDDVDEHGVLTLQMSQDANDADAAQALSASGSLGVYVDGTLVDCGQLSGPRLNVQVALIGRFPAMFASRTARGLAILKRVSHLGASRLEMRAIVHGLEPGFNSMWHIHRGHNCAGATEDVTFYEGIFAGYHLGRTSVRGLNGFNLGSYRADARGVALLDHVGDDSFDLDSPDVISVMSRELSEFSGECGGLMPPIFTGRSLVIHGRDGIYLGCGTIAGYTPGLTDAIASATRYKKYRGNLDVTALVHVTSNGSADALTVTAVLTGLAPSTEVKLSVHSGFECPGFDPVLATVYASFQMPFPSTIQTGDEVASVPDKSDEHGNALIVSELIGNVTMNYIAGRVVLVSSKDGEPLACGTLEPTTALFVHLPKKPPLIGGFLVAAQASSGVGLRGALLFDAAQLPGAKAQIVADCTSSPQELATFGFSAPYGAAQFKEHLLGVSIEGDAEPSLRGASVTIKTLGGLDVCAGGLQGPHSEVPMPPANVCTTEQSLRGAQVGGIILAASGFLFLVAMLTLLNLDKVSNRYHHLYRQVVKVEVAFVAKMSNVPGVAKLRATIAEPVAKRVSIPLANSKNRWRSCWPWASSTRAIVPTVKVAGGSSSDLDSAQRRGSGQRRRGSMPGGKLSSNTSKSHAAQILARRSEKHRKPRLLALHGSGSNDSVTKRQLSNIGIDEELFEIHYMQGPLAVAAGIGLEHFAEGPFFSWYSAESTGEEVLAMLASVTTYIYKNQIDCVFGFSQGAAVISAVLQPDILELQQNLADLENSIKSPIRRVMRGRRASIDAATGASFRRLMSGPVEAQEKTGRWLPERPSLATCTARGTGAEDSKWKALGGRKNSIANMFKRPLGSVANKFGSIANMAKLLARASSEKDASLQLKHVMLAHAVPTSGIRSCLDIRLEAPAEMIRLPSVHIIGTADAFKARSETAALAFRGGSMRLVVYHAGAHELPRELQTNELFHTRVMAHLCATLTASSATTAGSTSGPQVEQTSDVVIEMLGSKDLAAAEASARSATKTVFFVRTPSSMVAGSTEASAKAEKAMYFPAEYKRSPGATVRVTMRDEDGGSVRDVHHLIRPHAEERLPFHPISKLSTVWVSKVQQLVRVQISPAELAEEHTIRSMLARQPESAPFLRDAANPAVALTYGQLFDFMAAGGEGDLAKLGVKNGDAVVYVVPGGAIAAVAFLTIAAQCIAAPLDPTTVQNDAADALEQFGAEHVILFDGVSTEAVRAAAEATTQSGGKKVKIHRAAPKGEDWPGLFRLIPAEGVQRDDSMQLVRDEHDISLLLRTSGTTSKPKGVPLTQGAIVLNARLLASTIEITSKDVCLNVMPLFHIGGISASILATLGVGSSVTCIDAFSADKFYQALGAAPQPTWYSAVPTIHMAVVNHIKDNALVPSHSLRFIRSGAAALTPTDGKALSDCYGGIPIHGTYSMSEQMPISQPHVGLDQLNEKNGSVGIAVAASMAIVDPVTLAPQPPGERGVIAISGPTVITSYLNNPKADADNFFLLSCADGAQAGAPDKFFLTGDVGVLDEDGHLTIKGRSKELIKRGGEQVSPYEVEDALKEHEWVRMPVVFGVPSAAWGEEVGCVIILEPTAPAEAHATRNLLKEMRGACRAKGLAPNKWPSVAQTITWEELPKTQTKKPIRNGLAEKLGITPIDMEQQTEVKRGPPRLSRATEGVRYLLAAQVVFNHVGLQAPGGGTNMNFDYTTWGAFGQARFMCIHVPAFFILAGVGLSANMGPAARSKFGFFMARLSPMYPMYLVSLLLLLINTVAMCNPNNFQEDFHYLAQFDDATRGDFCEPAPLLSTWWGSLFSTVAIYTLGLQSWPIYLASWFLSYYAWFSSVYYAMLAAHPFFYSLMIKLRGQVRMLWTITLLMVILNYIIVAGWFIGWYEDRTYDNDLKASRIGTRDDESDFTGQFSLMYYLFPPFWFPTFALGTCAAFLFDYYRPYESHRAWMWGYATDLITLSLMFIGYVFYPLFSSCIQKDGLRCPSLEPVAARLAIDDAGLEAALGVSETDNIGIRSVAGIWSRFLTPLMVVWIFGLAVGRGGTCWVLTRPIFADVLAPISYNVYLFHQWVGQMYYLLTRQEWWSYWRYRKQFFWFSPLPVPVAWWEYFFVLMLTTFFSFFMARLDPWMISKWESARKSLRGCFSCGASETASQGNKTTLILVMEEIESLTGAAVEPDWTLAECGLASVAGPVVINRLHAAVPGVNIALSDLAEVETLEDLAQMLDKRLDERMAAGVGQAPVQRTDMS